MAQEWLAIWKARPAPPSIAYSAFNDYCRHVVMRQSIPSAIAALERNRGEDSEDGKLATRVLENVARVEACFKTAHDMVLNSPLAKHSPAARTCLEEAARAVTIDQTPCARGTCCLTGLSTVPLVTVILTIPKQSGSQRSTFCVCTVLYHFLMAWVCVNNMPALLAQYGNDWITEQRGIDHLAEVPTHQQLSALNALNRQLAYLTLATSVPNYIG